MILAKQKAGWLWINGLYVRNLTQLAENSEYSWVTLQEHCVSRYLERNILY